MAFGLIGTSKSTEPEELFEALLKRYGERRLRDIVFVPPVRIRIKGTVYMLNNIGDVSAIREAIRRKDEDKVAVKSSVVVGKEMVKNPVTNNVVFGSFTQPKTVKSNGETVEGLVIDGPKANGNLFKVIEKAGAQCEPKPKFVTFSELSASDCYKVASERTNQQSSSGPDVARKSSVIKIIENFRIFYERVVVLLHREKHQLDEDEVLDFAYDTGVIDPETMMSFESVARMDHVYSGMTQVSSQHGMADVITTRGLLFDQVLLMIGFMGDPTPIYPELRRDDYDPGVEVTLRCRACTLLLPLVKFFSIKCFQLRLLFGHYAPSGVWNEVCKDCVSEVYREEKIRNPVCNSCKETKSIDEFVHRDGRMLPSCLDCRRKFVLKSKCVQHGKDGVIWKPIHQPLANDAPICKLLDELSGGCLKDYQHVVKFIKEYRSGLRQEVMSAVGRVEKGVDEVVRKLIANNTQHIELIESMKDHSDDAKVVDGKKPVEAKSSQSKSESNGAGLKQESKVDVNRKKKKEKVKPSPRLLKFHFLLRKNLGLCRCLVCLVQAM
jgi:hypothetical protein